MILGRAGLILAIGILWSPWPTIIAILTPAIGLRPFGSTWVQVQISGMVGDTINIGIAAVLLALVLTLASERKLRWWGWVIVLLPAWVWAAFNLAPQFSLPGNAFINATYYLVALAVVPILITRLLGRLMNR